jgi:hypothetical protein
VAVQPCLIEELRIIEMNLKRQRNCLASYASSAVMAKVSVAFNLPILTKVFSTAPFFKGQPDA